MTMEEIHYRIDARFWSEPASRDTKAQTREMQELPTSLMAKFVEDSLNVAWV